MVGCWRVGKVEGCHAKFGLPLLKGLGGLKEEGGGGSARARGRGGGGGAGVRGGAGGGTQGATEGWLSYRVEGWRTGLGVGARALI